MLNFIKAFGVFLFWSAIGMAYLHYTDAFEKYKSYNDGFDVEEVDAVSGAGEDSGDYDVLKNPKNDYLRTPSDTNTYANGDLILDEINYAIEKNKEAAVEEEKRKELEKLKEDALRNKANNPPAIPPRKMGENIYPDFDDYNELIINSNLRKIGIFIKKQLDQNPDKKLLIIGHTDNVGNNNDNYLVALQHAHQFEKYLVKTFDIDNSRVYVDSKGEAEPIVPNTSVYRDKNNRIEILID